MELDFTKGEIAKQLLQFSYPILGANFLQSCYNIADMAVVGRFVGSEGLAAVSSASMLSFILNSVCTGITIGGSVLVSQYKGADDKQGQKETIGTLFFVSGIASIFLTILCLLVYRKVFVWMNIPSEAMFLADSYMKVLCFGTIFIFGYQAVCSVMRGIGDSKSPLIFVAVASMINILLDIVLVGLLKMETTGAALATIISQGISFFVAVFYLKKKDFMFDFCFHQLQMSWKHCKIILKIGLPTAIQMAILNLSYLLITGMLNRYGIAIASAAGIGLKINTFAAMPCWAIGQAVTAMTGQNIGAENWKRVEKITKYGVIIAVMMSGIAMILVQIFAKQIILFFNTDFEVVKEGILYLRICCSVNFIFYSVMYILDSFATGVGDSFFAMLNSMLHSVLMRLLLSWLFCFGMGFGFVGIYWGEMISPLLSFFVGIYYFYHGSWKKKKPII